MNTATQCDYIIVGGGTAGCVVASRLHEALPHLSIALIEAGEDASSDPRVKDPKRAQEMHDTELQWKYTPTPQAHLDGRTLPNWGGKLLSGSSAANYTAWTRGHAAEFDRWAQMVADDRWSYKSLLPAFKRSEYWHGSPSDRTADQHGFDGPIHTQSGDFGYPLREPVRKAFNSVGFKDNPDLNSGDPNGVAPLVLSWRNLERQHASACYPMEGVQVMCNSLVSEILFDENDRAIGVQLEGSGKKLRASKEVIISCGGIRTPQLLLLSGIGPKAELEAHDIRVRKDLPDVGKNYLDHHAVTMFWKLKDPDQGLALGAPSFNKPSFENSLPMDWMVTGSAPDTDLERAAAKDGTEFDSVPRSDYELNLMYLTNGAVPSPWLPFDGSYVSCGIMGLSSTSQGSIKLRSTDPRENPILDPNALSTEHDRAVLRAAMRVVIDAMSSAPMAPFLEAGETPPPGETSLSSVSTDEEFDKRIRSLAYPWFHAAGTAAMGRVVDTECRVKGVEGLRVVDTSITPFLLTAHLQAPMYGLAEQAASMIINPQA